MFYIVALLSWFGLLFVGLLLIVILRHPAQPSPQARPEPVITEGTAWEPAEYVLSGDWDSACVLADPNTKVGKLRREWLDYHDAMGNVTVVQPERAAVRQIGTSIRPLVRYE
jgi:protein required for attachment to host cells